MLVLVLARTLLATTCFLHVVCKAWASHSEAASIINRTGIVIYHGNVHAAFVYQHKTMTEIAEMMESNLLKLEALAKYQSWMHREEHLDHDSHQSNLKFFE